MTANSVTAEVSTNGEWELITDVAVGENFTGFTKSKTYSIGISNSAEIKIGDAIFPFRDEKFSFTMGDDAPYIKTGYSLMSDGRCVISILENA